MSSKRYGLILSDTQKPKQPSFQAAKNVFGSDSDSEGDTSKKPVLLRPSHNINRQAKVAQEKALLEDPTVYQYDEIYDEVKTKKENEKTKIKEDKKPKYIENLLKTASKRKIENERRMERQIQKEREKEGDEFKDKEVFVTSAYKKKLEELRLEEEKEKREEYLESIGDVTKQADLGGFYRHLYEQKLGKDETETSKTDPKEKVKSTFGSSGKDTETLKKRNYRKRQNCSDDKLSEGEIEDTDEEVNRANLENIRKIKRCKKNNENIDADSDFSIDESSDDEPEKKDKQPVIANKVEQNTPEPEKPDIKPKASELEPKLSKTKAIENVEVKPEKPKIDIWKKRTVGAVFEDALKRYYERKAARGR